MRSFLRTATRAVVAATTLATACGALAQEIRYSPYAGQETLPRTVYWGDTHLHSSLSTDAFGFGVTLGPDDAYRFAAGETVTATHGQVARLRRPLDFVVLSDHAESLGMMNLVREGDSRLLQDPEVARWHQLLNGSPGEAASLQRRFLSDKGRKQAFSKLDELSSPAMSLDVWAESLSIAERHYQPGVFTTLLGYEWTLAPGGSNLHRVVLFRDGPNRVRRYAPLSAYESKDPEELWAYLDRYSRETGGQVLAIPHNGNLSNGIMFPDRGADGEPLAADYLATRRRWEPVVEVTQIKGDGETHPLLSPDDEFADYETWDFGNFAGVPKTDDMLRFEYARAALRTGLQLEQATGINPYQFGMLGSTDSHTALATAEEDNFFGKHSGVEPGPQRMQHPVGRAADLIVRGWEQASSGYAAVWATDNTREALWDAVARREVYASTGPRITLRVFGGWDFRDEDLDDPDMVAIGYRKGVPMGGELAAGGASSPAFMIAALRDPLGANLDRVQVIKGWVDGDGKSHERVYDVAWSGKRRPDRDGLLPAVGSTVNVAAASWDNSIGAARLQKVWRDPDFDPAQAAFYYVRVLEIPTPRWTAYDAKRFGVSADESPMVTRERVYSSPIWYSPPD